MYMCMCMYMYVVLSVPLTLYYYYYYYYYYVYNTLLLARINILVFICCSQARNWIRELRRMLGDNIVVCIVGNKSDLEKNRTVSQRDAERSVILL